MASSKTSLDPPVLISFFVMLILALAIDILDWIFEIGTLLDLIAGWTIIPWLMWRTGGSSGIRTKTRGPAQQTTQQLAKKATRRALQRGILMFVLELIPLVNLIPWWTIQVIATLWQKSDEPEAEQQPASPAGGPAPQQMAQEGAGA